MELLRARSTVVLALALSVLGCQQGLEVPVENDSGQPPFEDGGSTGATFDCNPGVDDDCPSGQRCTVVLDGSTRDHYVCVDITTSDVLWGSCSVDAMGGEDGCPPGSACLVRDEDGDIGVCAPLCLNANDCDDDSAACVANQWDGVPVCGNACNPLTPQCPTQSECLAEQGGTYFCQIPGPFDDGIKGQTCDLTTLHGCSEGYYCIQAGVITQCESDGCCTQLCSLSGEGECELPELCGPLTENPEPGYEDVGACYTPA